MVTGVEDKQTQARTKEGENNPKMFVFAVIGNSRSMYVHSGN